MNFNHWFLTRRIALVIIGIICAYAFSTVVWPIVGPHFGS